jgi:glycosyltransferase involved in cell wall biosynthesis
MEPLLTISIATINRVDLLKIVLESIKLQTDFDSNLVEVDVVVDGYSDLETKCYLEKFQMKNFRFFVNESGGLSKARNFGARVARGKFIRFQDDDDSMAPGSISQLLSMHLKFPQSAILGRTVVRKNASDFMKWATEESGFLFKYSNLREFESLDFSYFWGGRISLPKDYLLQLGFDENLTFGAEDIDWAYRFSNLNKLEIVFCPEILGIMERDIDLYSSCFRALSQGWANGYLDSKHQGLKIKEWIISNSGGFIHFTNSEIIDEISFMLDNWLLFEKDEVISKFIIQSNSDIKSFRYGSWWRLINLCKALGYTSSASGITLHLAKSQLTDVISAKVDYVRL